MPQRKDRWTAGRRLWRAGEAADFDRWWHVNEIFRRVLAAPEMVAASAGPYEVTDTERRSTERGTDRRARGVGSAALRSSRRS